MNVISEIEAKEIVSIVMKNGKGLRASKPSKKGLDPKVWGRAVVVWREAAFYLSGDSKMQCIPCTHDFCLCDEDWNNRKDIMVDLREIVNHIVDSVPVRERKGVIRWAVALGAI